MTLKALTQCEVTELF